jgi:hypothetical protein
VSTHNSSKHCATRKNWLATDLNTLQMFNAMPRQLRGKKNKMENAMLCQIIITLAVAWYAGAAIIEKKPTNKPMATRRKEQGE